MKMLWDDLDLVEIVDHKPVLFPFQQDLLERGRQAYLNGARRVIFQASCGAGKTVIAGEQTRRALALGKTVLHVVHRRRLVDQMLGLLAKFGIKAAPIMEGREAWGSPVKCASRDTLLAILKSGRDLPRADLIIPDECHVSSTAVNDWYLRNCPQSHWTGYTATPVCTDGRSLNPPYQTLVCSAPASELLKIKRLCPVKVFNPDQVGQRRKKGEKVKPVGDPVDHWLKFGDNQPTVCFSAKVPDSKELVRRYLMRGITAEHIDSGTPEEEREAVFERSRLGQTKIISNVGVMVEGVDLPWLVCCQILRGCDSLVLWIQATGRVMRWLEGKSHGIILDHAGAAHEFGLPDSDFQWTLEDEKANTKKNKPPKDRKPTACLACGFVFSGKPACPECGRQLPKQRRKSAFESMQPGDGVLTEFNGDQTNYIQQDKLKRIWTRLLFMGRAKGWQMRVVAGIFTKQAKVPPWESGLDVPMPRGKEGWAMPVSQWIEENR